MHHLASTAELYPKTKLSWDWCTDLTFFLVKISICVNIFS